MGREDREGVWMDNMSDWYQTFKSDSGAYACILKRVLGLLAKLQLRNSMMLHPLKGMPAPAVIPGSLGGGIEALEHTHQRTPLSLRVKAIKEFNSFTLSPPVRVVKDVLMQGDVPIMTKDADLMQAKAFAIELDMTRPHSKGKLRIYNATDTENYVLIGLNTNDGVEPIQLVELLKEKTSKTDIISCVLHLSFEEDILLATINARMTTDGKKGPRMRMTVRAFPTDTQPIWKSSE